MYFKTFKYVDIRSKVEAAKEKVQKKMGEKDIDLNFAELTDEQIREIKDTVVLYKGNLDDLEYVTSILLPRDIKDLQEITFQEIERDIRQLYENLDLFKDSLIEYHKAEQTSNERDKAVTAFDDLEKSYKLNFSGKTQGKFNFEPPTQKQENKSLKKLDKLIERVILEHINK